MKISQIKTIPSPSPHQCRSGTMNVSTVVWCWHNTAAQAEFMDSTLIFLECLGLPVSRERPGETATESLHKCQRYVHRAQSLHSLRKPDIASAATPAAWRIAHAFMPHLPCHRARFTTSGFTCRASRPAFTKPRGSLTFENEDGTRALA